MHSLRPILIFLIALVPCMSSAQRGLYEGANATYSSFREARHACDPHRMAALFFTDSLTELQARNLLHDAINECEEMEELVEAGELQVDTLYFHPLSDEPHFHQGQKALFVGEAVSRLTMSGLSATAIGKIFVFTLDGGDQWYILDLMDDNAPPVIATLQHLEAQGFELPQDYHREIIRH